MTPIQGKSEHYTFINDNVKPVLINPTGVVNRPAAAEAFAWERARGEQGTGRAEQRHERTHRRRCAGWYMAASSRSSGKPRASARRRTVAAATGSIPPDDLRGPRECWCLPSLLG